MPDHQNVQKRTERLLDYMPWSIFRGGGGCCCNDTYAPGKPPAREIRRQSQREEGGQTKKSAHVKKNALGPSLGHKRPPGSHSGKPNHADWRILAKVMMEAA